MSGHSKWHSIKHKKAANDAKRSKMFGALSREIRQAARNNNDPAKNSSLRDVIERAKKNNLPQKNIDRLLKRGDGALKDVTYEGYGPGGAALLIFTATDNTNRTVSELRTIMKNHGGSLGEPGSVAWKFQRTEIVFVALAHLKIALNKSQQTDLNALLDELHSRDDVLAIYDNVA